MRAMWRRTTVLSMLFLAAGACSSSGGGEEDADADAPAEAEAEGGADADADGDGEAETPAEAEAGADADAGADGDVEEEGDGDLDGDAGDGEEANVCVLAGGICTAAMMCLTTTLPEGAPGCIFDDGPGVCCVPPPPLPTGETCSSFGGVCATVGACLRSLGWFAPSDCELGASVVCCVPEQRCGEHNVICCDPGPEADFMPVCDRGTLTCPFEGTTLVPEAECV